MRTNWAGNVRFTASGVVAPRSVDEVAEVVAAADAVTVLGTGHAFSPSADGALQLSVADLDVDATIDHGARTVTVCAGWTYTRLADLLAAEGLALANLASLPDISIGGAIASATHGSGRGLGNLATDVAALELVTADGEVLWLGRGEGDFDGAIVAMGCLGVVTRVALDLQPADEVRQRVTWYRDRERDLERAIPIVHEALAPFDARVHLAKMTPVLAADVARLYPRHADFVSLADRLDPRGVFRNRWARRVIFGG